MSRSICTPNECFTYRSTHESATEIVLVTNEGVGMRRGVLYIPIGTASARSVLDVLSVTTKFIYYSLVNHNES